MLRIWYLMLLVFLGWQLTAQNSRPRFFSVSPKTGFLIAHRPNMSHLVQENSYGYELTAWEQFNEEDENTTRLAKPLKGISLEFRNFGYNEVLGSAFSSTLYMVFPIFQTKRNLFVDVTIGTGAGYLTKCYSALDNPLNNAIGSKWNGRVNLKFSVLKYYERFHWGGGLEFMHFSNGSIQTPNLGLNLPSVYLQVGYNLEQREIQTVSRKSKVEPDEHKNRLTVEGILSCKEIGAVPFLPKRYPVLASRIGYSWSKNGLWSADFAIDFIHNEANFHKYHDTTFVRSDILQIGLYGGTSINFYKCQLAFGLGWYARDNINAEGRMYNRIGYRYYFHEKWFALFNIKANYAKADYFEFGIGFKVHQW